MSNDSRAGESLKGSNSKEEENSDFLNRLKAAMGEDVLISNEDTIGAGNTEKHRTSIGNLEDLFLPPPPPPPTTTSATQSNDHEYYEEKKGNTPDAPQRSKQAFLETLQPNPASFTMPPRKSPPPPAIIPRANQRYPPSSSDSPTPLLTNQRKHAAVPEANVEIEFLSNLGASMNQPGQLSPNKMRAIRDVGPPILSLPPPRPQGMTSMEVSGAPVARPANMRHHKREVSWGAIEQPPPPPHVNEEGLDDSLDRQHSLSSTSQAHRRLKSRARILSLDDILRSSPLEQEAETCILKALDTLQAPMIKANSFRRPRADTGTSTILSQVPDTASHDFSIESDDDTNDEDDDSNPGEDHDENQVGSQQSRDTSKGSNNPASPRITRPLVIHRRHVSVEQALLGLTSVMAWQDNLEASTTARDDLIPQSIGGRYPQGDAADELIQNSAIKSWLGEGKASIQPAGNLETVIEDDGERGDRLTVRSTDEENPPENQSRPNSKSGRRRLANSYMFTTGKLMNETEQWSAFYKKRKRHVYAYVKNVMLYLILPATITAAILFYLAGNPQTGTDVDDSATASVSWWLIFVCVRQVITFSLAFLLQSLVIDYLALSSQVMLKVLGPTITLLVVQSKGWPFIVCWWSAINLSMLYGTGPFAAHWAYYQNMVGLFNDKNPSGHVVDNIWNRRILTIGLCVSIVVAVKRFLVGIFLGRQTYVNFGERLAKLMQKMLLVREVAKIAKEFERSANGHDLDMSARRPLENTNHSSSEAPTSVLQGLAYASQRSFFASSNNDEDNSSKRSLDTAGKAAIDMDARDPLTGGLRDSEKIKIMQLLDEWEEPEREASMNERATISAVLRFRKALTFLRTEYPFSFNFGPADTRENCIDSAQQVYNRLLLNTPEREVLHFNTIALLAEDDDGTIDQEKAMALMKLFRPDRQGNLSCLDFVKSVDAVYKKFKLILASIDNSSQIDRSFELIINVVFYIVVVTVILSQVGLDPLSLFLSLSSIILAFAFIIGSASSKYFEGLLFVLVRRPYNVGDRIHISNVQEDTAIEGSRGWVVENITLFETTAVLGPTQERCSLSNASLAYSRIINGARSPQAQMWIYLKFPIDTSYDKMLVFRSAVEEYLKARPREWLSLKLFLAQDVVSDQGYVKYAIVVQHRYSWQDIAQLLDSKASLSSYCAEVQKQLGMNYHAPSLPVDLKYAPASMVAASDSNDDMDSVAQRDGFRSMALNHH